MSDNPIDAGAAPSAPAMAPSSDVTPPPAAPVGADAVTVLEPSAVQAMPPARILEEAVAQLRKLSEMREQEIKRSEALMAEVREHVQRHASVSRRLTILSAVVLVLVLSLALGVHRLRKEQSRTQTNMQEAATKIDRLNSTVLDSSMQQGTRFDGITTSLEETTKKLGEVQSGVAATVDNSLQAVRQEREAVRTEVRLTLDNQNRQIVEREVALRDEEARILLEAERARVERARILRETIDKLTALSGEAKALGAAAAISAPEAVPVAAPVVAPVPAATPHADAPAAVPAP